MLGGIRDLDRRRLKWPKAYVIDAVRTAVGKRNGSLAGVHPVDLGAAGVARACSSASTSTRARWTTSSPAVSTRSVAQAGNIARLSWLAAGFPEEVPGVTVDRQCGSSQQAISFGAQAIMSGTADLIVAGGMQNMSQIPISSAMTVAEQFGFTSPTNESKSWLHRYGDQEISQFRGSELIAEKWDISREEMEQYALTSHQRAQAAIRAGHFENEIIEVDGFAIDEGPRDTSLEKMAGLKTLVEGGRLTAAMASQISDGASAVLLASESAVKAHNLKPRARIHHISARGADPVFMLTGPDPRDPLRAGEDRAVDRGHRHRRDQRGVRARRAGVAQGDQGRPGEGQSERRCDRARASARGHRRKAFHHDAEHVGAHRRSLRPADDVRGRRHRQRHHHRAPLDRRNAFRAVRVTCECVADVSGREDDAADIAAGQHVRVALVDLGQFVLVGDGLVEQ